MSNLEFGIIGYLLRLLSQEHGIDPDAMIPIDNTCSLRSSLPKAGDTKNMGIMER